ncbi:MAG: hypothetical protein IPI81_01460 [Flavobacteriales bacterium]|nr:hypothetical protein [Flavobacteriales bacterium]MCC6939944.1 hypothetical protein [Flavobacteriales bacterium]
MRTTLLLLLILLCGMAVHAQDADTTTLRKAKDYLQAKKCKDVNRVLAPMLTETAPKPDALLIRAKCRIYHEGKPQEGMADLQRALDIEPDHFKVKLFRGDLYNDWDMFDRAESDLNDAVTLAPDSLGLIEALNRRAWNSMDLRKFQSAKSDCERVLLMDSTNRAALNNLGLACNDLGDTATTFRCLKAMVRLDPKDDVAWLNTGFFLGTLGRHKEALVYYDEAEKLGRKDARFFNNRGFSRLGAGDMKGARKDIERSLEMDARNSYAYRNLAHLEIAAGNKDAACTAMERAMELGFTERYGKEMQEMRKTNCN